MASKEKFFPDQIDRTPYASCTWLAIFILAIFIGGVMLLWNIAGAAKSVRFPEIKGFRLPQTSGSNIVDQVKEAGQEKSQELQNQAEQKVKEKAEEEVKNQINQAKEQYIPNEFN